ncbi:MAG: hypothetical protein M0R33_17115 [Methylomonas sp.]|jgi:hypothetical protein|uniref:hypothetical protein n=1 Tax=Methylomonas sp. TaxID=418 RepID=UPI0025D3FCF9|nr:hypothetical protein [Methylomonas sp.]MCK9608167.1 hypothetical protein [Methylomonas sp.]
MDICTLSPFTWQEIIEKIVDYRVLWCIRAVSRDFRDIADMLIAKKSRFTLDRALAKRESPCRYLYFQDVGRYCTRADIALFVKSGAKLSECEYIIRGVCSFGRIDLIDLLHTSPLLLELCDFTKPACKYRRISIMRRLLDYYAGSENKCMKLYPPGNGVSADANAAYLAWHKETFSGRFIDYAETIAAYAGMIGDRTFLEKCGLTMDSAKYKLFCFNAIKYGHTSVIERPTNWEDCFWSSHSIEIYESLDRNLIETFEHNYGRDVSNLHYHTLPVAIKKNRQDIIDWILSETEITSIPTGSLVNAAKRSNFATFCILLIKCTLLPGAPKILSATLRAIFEIMEYRGDTDAIEKLNKLLNGEPSTTSQEH